MLPPPEIDFEKAKILLSEFRGGEVTLSTQYFDKGLAVIMFNNPGKKNAISGKMMVELRQCIKELEGWREGKAVLLCGLNGNFCSGGDLELAKATGTPEAALQMSCWMQDTLSRLQNLPIFSLCLIQGPTIGGGAEVSIACDFIVAADDVKFGFVQGKMGIITAWGGTTRLVRKIGHKKALDLLLTSKILTAKQCVETNIADHIVSADNAFLETLKWIDSRLQHNHQVIQTFKKVVQNSITTTLHDSLDFERKEFVPFWGGKLNREALSKNIKHITNSQM